nr:MAG TPA: hypothetical protein [Caudoviricetes sp.]DAY46300.1 MAG TPA: hypothetical protein [Caudoviricetes sp.]
MIVPLSTFRYDAASSRVKISSSTWNLHLLSWYYCGRSGYLEK